VSDEPEQLDDPLARLLWTARETATEVPSHPDWESITLARAGLINDQLVGRIPGDGPGAWKMGAFDDVTQQRLGLTAPLVCRVLPDGLRVGVDEVRLDLADLVRPKLEPEIGIRVEGDSLRLVPCVELADCRFPQWQVPRRAALADFGLQGAMIFGTDVEPVDEVHVTVHRDGAEVATATASWASAVERLAFIAPTPPAPFFVATGAMTPLLDAEPGTWQFVFHDVGVLTLVLS
jgi:2-keto-4-pentenoate hydratase